MSRIFNTSFTNIEKSFNDICYEFTSLRNTNLILQNSKKIFSFKQFIENNVTHSQILVKQLYNQKHKFIQFRIND